MRVNHGGQSYRVWFSYLAPEAQADGMMGAIADAGESPVMGDSARRTFCYIAKWKDDPPATGVTNTIGYGMAKCGKHDHFVKNAGRKVALTRALALAFPKMIAGGVDVNRQTRVAFWTAYFVMRHGKW